jgi:deoxycytidine triphosphate deaminase
MILSNEGIKKALAQAALEISPAPDETQYTTSAVDLHLGSEFYAWDASKLQVTGVKVELDLSAQKFNETAKAYLIPLKKED